MVNLKMLTAAAALASFGLAGPALAGDTTPATTIHDESPRAGTSSSLGTDPDAMEHDKKQMDHKKDSDDAVATGRKDFPTEAGKEIHETDEVVRESAYKKTYPEEPEVSELDE